MMLTFLVVAILAISNALYLEVPSGKKRCLGEILSPQNNVSGFYRVILNDEESRQHEASLQRYKEKLKQFGDSSEDIPAAPIFVTGVQFKITGPKNTNEYTAVDGAGSHFAFTATDGGNHEICFTNKSSVLRKVEFEWSTGSSQLDLDVLANKEQLMPLELELRKIEHRIESVYQNMVQLRQNEEDHRNTNESTNTRVAVLSMLTIILVICQGFIQVWYLYNYLKKRGLLKTK